MCLYGQTGLSSDFIIICNGKIDHLEDHSTINLKLNNYKRDQYKAK